MQNNHRRCLIAGNWKMNYASSDATELVQVIKDEVGHLTDTSVAVCPPYTALECVANVIEDSNVQLGAQNMNPETNGAYTGEISAEMLRALFCNFVILGHSERRIYFEESDNFINRKVITALRSNLKPILCVGETQEERDRGESLDIVGRQIEGGLANVPEEKLDRFLVAYEPVWAIGTGVTASPDMAQEVHHEIRKMLAAKFSDELANRIRILYGGSMKPDNASDLLDQPDIDGGLVGGASLEAKAFIKLVEIAHEKVQG